MIERREETDVEERTEVEEGGLDGRRRGAFLLDLALYLAVMFLVREIYFPRLGFIANGLFWSLTTLAVASWRMRARGVGWRDLGLRRPKSLPLALLCAGGILVAVLASVVFFELVKDRLPLPLPADTSEAAAVSKFGNLAGNWGLVMGTAYVLCGRNLWPLIVAHCVLNAASMLGRVL